jgi:hypothetical protein
MTLAEAARATKTELQAAIFKAIETESARCIAGFRFKLCDILKVSR